MWRRILWWKFTEDSEKPVSYFPTLKLEARGSSETLLDLYQSKRRQIPESDITELKYAIDVHKNKRFVTTAQEPWQTAQSVQRHGYGLDGPEFESQHEQEISLFWKHPD